MKNNKNRITKAKTMMMLSIISAFLVKYDSISKACTLTLNSIKSTSSKIEIGSARIKTLLFLNSIPKVEINSNDLTLLSFADKSLDILIENSVGNGKIRSFDSIKDMVLKELDGVDNTQENYSEMLIKIFK